MTIIGLFVIMTSIIIAFIDLKFKAQVAKQDNLANFYGLMVSATIKFFQVIYDPISNFYSNKEN